ncbi:DUF1801 domain-containing protein [Mucilaginibacter terrae]|uniref:YdhG-like domain-containing protein n=1 Tax=Mucilaginibacter terrae TaxID=1955052 RepID=A0ABU3GSX7_9SPHI|nr:DUF1801 domain-containing protein [Mucilaginibacter terrae]MDT3402889.1 hypothetical protein [Mucilaginibacter terrae]
MAKPNQTIENQASVTDFINTVADETKRADSFKLIDLMSNATGLPAKMWGPAIVGFGSYHYKYESGREGDAPRVGFSPRANALTLYLAMDFPRKEQLLAKLGKHKTSVACIYIKKLADVDLEVLKEMIADSVKYMGEKYL